MLSRMTALLRWLPVLAWIVATPAGAASPFFDPGIPLHGSPVDTGANGVISRGLLISAGEREWVVFDQDLLRPALWFRSPQGKSPLSLALMAQASWDEPTRKGGVKVPVPATPGIALTPALPGIGADVDAISRDPRPLAGKDPGRGGLEESDRTFSGYLLAGDTAVLHYRSGNASVREWYEVSRGNLLRHFVVDPGGELVFLIAAGEYTVEGGRTASSPDLHVASNHRGLKLESNGGRLIARLSSSDSERRVTLAYGSARPGEIGRTPATPSFHPTRWKSSVETRWKSSDRSGPGWEIDRLALPENNPWKRRVRPADIAFLAPDRAVAVTFEGDVWRLDLQGDYVRWSRIAAGLCEPLSIGVTRGVVQVFTRHGLVRLKDLDGDGETDYYENHCSLIKQTAGTRGYPLDMEVAEDGRTWCSIGGIATDDRSITNRAPDNPHSGAILEISADGKSLSVIGAHAREPFFARDPDTERIAMSDQQGHWVPSSGAFSVPPGASFAFGRNDASEATPPAVWIPHDQDSSSSSPLWMRGNSFKAWEGGLLQISYGTGRLFLVRFGEGWPATSGAVIPLGIETGIPLLHARHHPVDGSIWLAGFRVYDSRVPDLQGIGRLRATGSPLASPRDARIVKEGVVLTFDSPLDPASVVPESVEAREWQYRRSGGYGSPRLKRDGTQGVDPVAVGTTVLSEDRRSVFIHLPQLRPTMQLEISHRFKLRGSEVGPGSVFFTAGGEIPPADWQVLGFDVPDLDGSVVMIREGQGGDSLPASAERGMEISTRYGCIACHSTDGATEGHSGPTWKGLFGSERKFTDGTRRVADETYLREAILEPDKTIVEGFALGMGSYAGILKDEELESVILYIKSLK